MKKFFCSVLLAILALSGLQAQTVRVTGNECLELLNTVWILANGSSDADSYQNVTGHFGDFSTHRVVDMLRKQNHEVMVYGTNFENVVLPYTALQMKIGKNGTIVFDMKEFESGKMLRSYWKADEMPKFIDALGDFYQKSEFNRYYTSVMEKEGGFLSMLNINGTGVNLTDINRILGSDIKDVNFVVGCHLDRINPDYAVPFVYVDGRLLPMYFDVRSELVCPSGFVKSGLAQRREYALGLFTALVAEELRNEDGNSFIPEYYGALLTLVDSENDKQGFQLWNFMSRWAPLLLMDEYMKDTPDADRYIAKAENWGFFWHRSAMEYMQYYYTNRDKYPQFIDFVPQLTAYIAYLPENIALVKSGYDVRNNAYVESIYPSPRTELDMSGSTIDFEVKFSQPVIASTVKITINSLYKPSSEISITRSMTDDRTLKFSIPTDVARQLGFYGLTVNAVSRINRPVKALNVTYFQPDRKKR